MSPKLKVAPVERPAGFLKSIWLTIRPGIARHRRNPLVRLVSKFSRAWLKAYENCDGNIEANGEQMILKSLAGAGFKTVFDVGANYGQWAMTAHHFWPTATIHSFELSPPTFQHLLTNVEGVELIQTFNFGLSEKSGAVEFYHYPHLPGESSLLAHPYQQGAEKLEGRVETGDAFCRENGIEHIDFLKIDVEGMESAVLAGFSEMLSGGKIDVIQFEYEKVNALTKFLLTDFYEQLGRHGYKLGKVFPSYVDFREYDFSHELDWGSNYLAVRIERQDLLERLPR